MEQVGFEKTADPLARKGKGVKKSASKKPLPDIGKNSFTSISKNFTHKFLIYVLVLKHISLPSKQMMKRLFKNLDPCHLMAVGFLLVTLFC